MQTLLMLQGLPGSGKTTLANKMIFQRDEDRRFDGSWGNKIVRVNKDDIRRELEQTGWVWSRENERQVVETRDRLITEALRNGFDVISDDTNFGRSHKLRLEELARTHGAVFEVHRLDTPIEQCIARDAQREGKAHVGEAVIRRMAKEAGLLEVPKVVKYMHEPGRMPAIICDLDGTLSLFHDEDGRAMRSPYDASTCENDRLNVPVRKVIEVFYRFMNWQIIYLSGREDKYRAQTNVFLRKYHCPPGPLHMRSTGDKRKDSIVKSELFDANVREKYNVQFVFDDRNQVVDMWRSLGLTCFQVARGDF